MGFSLGFIGDMGSNDCGEAGREAMVGTFVIAELVEALNKGMIGDEEGRKREVGGG
jgi:hypothetical protein